VPHTEFSTGDSELNKYSPAKKRWMEVESRQTHNHLAIQWKLLWPHEHRSIIPLIVERSCSLQNNLLPRTAAYLAQGKFKQSLRGLLLPFGCFRHQFLLSLLLNVLPEDCSFTWLGVQNVTPVPMALCGDSTRNVVAHLV
jgi:hypothetical protein